MVASESTLVLILFAGLAIIDFTVTVFAAGFFLLVGFVLQRLLSKWARRIGTELFDLEVLSTTKLREAMRTYRELHVYGQISAFNYSFAELRLSASRIQADAYLMNMISKYVYEIALIVGAGLLAAFELATSSWNQALAVLAIFIAGSTRILPSLMRMQQAALQIKSASGQGQSTLELVNDLDFLNSQCRTETEEIARNLQSPHEIEYQFAPTVELFNVSYRYPGAQKPALQSVSLQVKAGSTVAIVGPSGSGKSTLADMMMGLLNPDTGDAQIGGLPTAIALSYGRRRIAYVPQECVMLEGSIRDNIVLGREKPEAVDTSVWRALGIVGLEQFVSDLPEQLDFSLGEDGDRLSGGQKQRIGLARALFDSPDLLVLDEATSSLDADSERAITNAIDHLGSSVTRVIIAHRLSTVQSADMVVYLNDGHLITSGSFASVRATVPDFDRQAALMGINPL
jgi:ABC-type multidrug transport system fused ATPase/permease subunit